MAELTEGRRAGPEALATVTALLQRVRLAHPTSGLYEAAEMQWWWTIPRSTDELDQLFWFDDDGRPAAGVVATDWGDGSSAVYDAPTLVVVVMPDAGQEWVTHVVERGLSHAAAAGIGTVELEVDRADTHLRDVLAGHGFTVADDGLIQCWLAAADRPPVSPLADGYRLVSRRAVPGRPHHMTERRRQGFEQRLTELSLYRDDLDLVVLDAADEPAAYGLFWFDPVSATGVVEPMRTHDRHQRRGLGRHVLTAGVDALARAGAERISIGFEPENPASGPLYRSVGFRPHQRTDVLRGPTAVDPGAPASA